MHTQRREKIRVNGIVQGVGFRPFVFRLAQECNLTGFVNNGTDGVLIEVQGSSDHLDVFRERMVTESPPLANIVDLHVEQQHPRTETEFIIRTSSTNGHPVTLIAPDVSTCDACLRELFDPADRRYRYPFINCTNCGPRYTIVESIPYDRPFTSMRVFPICPACSDEYHDPSNRRFHAQPNACPDCGPQVWLCDADGHDIQSADPIVQAVQLLKAGKIVAIRGVGGFHLAVDACNDAAVRRLRRRKGRAEKPFAMMVPDVNTVKRFCVLSEHELTMLRQATRPIVLLKAYKDTAIAASVAPGNRYLGFMLPYTPLHHLLLHENFEALVMTSGNFTEEPIAIGNDEALQRLSSLADYFLLHDRQILQRCDDSIAAETSAGPQILRRSRGYVPAPVFLPTATQKPILACGGELKNTVALSRGKAVFLSQHIGDLDNPAAYGFFENSIAHLQDILQIRPQLIVHDLHPEYLSTKWAVVQDDLPKIAVQHHHAHLVSVMADNSVTEPTIGIILDGTGYGTDGTIWGGEVLVGDASGVKRCAWLRPASMPGAGAAVLQPWRMAVSYLYDAFGPSLFDLDLPFLRQIDETQLRIVLQMIEKRVNAPLTSSCGRLFDAVSALLGIRTQITYEAQAAIELEMTVDETYTDIYAEALYAPCQGAISTNHLVRAIVQDMQLTESVSRISAKFHRTLAEIFLQAALTAQVVTGINRVGLSGGVYQNRYFFDYFVTRLHENGFDVLTHKQVPANDGGLALGQIVIGDAASK